MRSVHLTEQARYEIPRSSFRIAKITRAESDENCVWYDLSCTTSTARISWDGFVEDTVIPGEDGFINVRTVVPAPGSIVEESMAYRSSMVGIKYVYLDVLHLNRDEMSVSCAKMSMQDQKVYEDKFHLLAPFTALYIAACLGNGKSVISSATGIKSNLRIFR